VILPLHLVTGILDDRAHLGYLQLRRIRKYHHDPFRFPGANILKHCVLSPCRRG
jgi:hypothetical protein